MDKRKALKSIPAFARLSRRVQGRLAAAAGLQRIGKGSTLFREGESAEYVYALVEGHVALVSGSDRAETIADFMTAGELVLVPPALLDLSYMLTGKVTDDVLALLIPAAEFRRLVAEETAFAEAIAKSLAMHWRFLLGQLKQIKMHDAGSRLAYYLLNKAGKGSGSVQIELPGPKRQLAAHLGMSPETLSRALKTLSRLGIGTTGRTITVSSLARLGTFVSGPLSKPHSIQPPAIRRKKKRKS